MHCHKIINRLLHVNYTFFLYMGFSEVYVEYTFFLYKGFLVLLIRHFFANVLSIKFDLGVFG